MQSTAASPDTPQPAASSEVILRTRKLCKVYGKGEVQVHALRDVDLDLRAGEMSVLLGASGSGKSTLLSLLPRFYDVTGGAVTVNGRDIRELKLHDLEKLFGRR